MTLPLPAFSRGSLPDLWIGLEASDPLGLVDGLHRVKDVAGIGGQVGLRCVQSGAVLPVPMAAWGGDGAALGGHVPMGQLASGEYRVEGQAVTTLGVWAQFSLGFTLVDGPAPVSGSLAVDQMATSPAVVVAQSVDLSAVAMLQSDAVIAFPAAPAPSVGEQASGPVILIMLQPGISIAFPAWAPPLVVFPPALTTVEF